MNKSDLHEYQKWCIDFVKERPEAMLILEMGLGKSIIALTAIMDLMFDRFEVSKTLVIAPLRVARDVWPGEAVKWEHTAGMLRLSIMTGDLSHREAALRAPADVYVINRENVPWLTKTLEDRGEPWPFDMVVIDELSSFKNSRSRRWKALNRIRPKVKRILGLTGTPAGNGFLDLWAEAYLIDQGQRLGHYFREYKERYFHPAARNMMTGAVYHYMLLPGSEEKIYARLSDITVSMKALDYLKMPERVEVNHMVEMDESERYHYDQLRKEMVTSLNGEAIDAVNSAVLCGKLQQMANGAVYGEERKISTLHNRKLDMLEELVEEANGQPVLIAYWFRHDLVRIMERLAKLGYHPREMKSDKDIADWNAGRIEVALISPASAGHGLNLQQGGHILIWFSPIWSLELYQQTNARLWRQGQRKVVIIHHILTDETIDEDILTALARKDDTQQRLINAVNARLDIPDSNKNTAAEGGRGAKNR